MLNKRYACYFSVLKMRAHFYNDDIAVFKFINYQTCLTLKGVLVSICAVDVTFASCSWKKKKPDHN